MAKLDQINERILQELGRNGRISNLELAERVGMSPSACLRRDHTKAAQEAFERAIARAPEVRECHNTTGTIEYMLRVECADLQSYKAFHTDMLGALPQVNAITSYVVMGSPKDERA